MLSMLEKFNCLLNLPRQRLRLNNQTENIEDIYSFAVNTINIFMECNEKTSVFSRVQSTSEYLNVFIT